MHGVTINCPITVDNPFPGPWIGRGEQTELDQLPAKSQPYFRHTPAHRTSRTHTHTRTYTPNVMLPQRHSCPFTFLNF